MAEVANFTDMQRELKRCAHLGIEADFAGQSIVLMGGGCDTLRFPLTQVDRLKTFIDGYEHAMRLR